MTTPNTKADALARMLGVRLTADAAHAGQTVGVAPLPTAKTIEVDRIIPDPKQPRRVFDDADLDDLGQSLKNHGQLQPIRVRWDAAADRWMLVAGERRYRAAVKAGIRTLEATIMTQSDPADRVLAFQMVENALRADLTPLEAGAAYRELMAVWNCTQQELAARLHVSQSKVSRAIAALDLPADVQQAVDDGKVGAVSAVKQARRKPSSRKPSKPKPVRIVTGAGVVIVMPRPGQSVVDVLMAAVESEQKRGAA